MGDFQPDAQVKGFDGWSLIALTLRSFSAVNFCTEYVIFFSLIDYKSTDFGVNNVSILKKDI